MWLPRTVGVLLLLYWWLDSGTEIVVLAQDRANDNGDVYVVSVSKLLQDVNGTMAGEHQDNAMTTTAANDLIDVDAAMNICNESFIIPKDYVETFKDTGELPHTEDKTAMCFLRCVYEKIGLINNWQLDADKIRTTIWPATGDSIDVCQQQGNREVNACIRTYAIFKCLMTRAIVDARNKPTV